MERVFGLEQEMAMAAFDRDGQRIETGYAAERFIELAARSLAHLPAKHGSGMFLTNGARLYIDCGKPEITTPEVCRPEDACRYSRAGEVLLAQLARELPHFDPRIGRVVLTRCNVSYGRLGSTFGNHESFGHRADPAHLPPQLIPHLVTRLIYTGAGGFDNNSPGIEFLLSPRVSHLTQAVSAESQRNRGIFHTKDESLSQAGYHRMHVLCGESVGSEISLWLRMATTALIVAIVEAGRTPGDAVALVNPLLDMTRLAMDVTLSHRLTLVDGSMRSAIAIQRHYLRAVEACLPSGFLPAWSPAACAAWRRMLDRLELGVEEVRRTLDWAIKQTLYQRHVQRRGIRWESLPAWNRALSRLQQVAVASSNTVAPPPEVTVELLEGSGPVAVEAQRLTPHLAQAGLSWSELPRFLEVRQELFELDTRFGELSDSGVFAQLDRQGVLDHRVPAAADVRSALVAPPTGTRARLRGEFVKKFHQQGDGYWCDWTGCWNLHQKRQLDLLDPLTKVEVWQSWTSEDAEHPDSMDSSIRHVMEQLVSDYDSGRYDLAYYWFETLRMVRRRLPRSRYRDLSRYAAWIQARRGELDGPELLDELARVFPVDLVMICDYVCVYRFQGLVPPPEIEPWLERGLACIQRIGPVEQGTVAAFLGHYAYYLLGRNRVAEASVAIEQACVPSLFNRAHWRTQSRLLAKHAEVLRRSGDPERAGPLLEQAEALGRRQACPADLPELVWTRQAKRIAEQEPAAARALLRRARRAQAGSRQSQGLARTLLLEARLAPRTTPARRTRTCEVIRRRVERLRDERPALHRCVLLARILENWNAWTNGDMLSGETDYFWRL